MALLRQKFPEPMNVDVMFIAGHDKFDSFVNDYTVCHVDEQMFSMNGCSGKKLS